MWNSRITPVSSVFFLLLWLFPSTGRCQFGDPYGGPPFPYGDPYQYNPFFPPPPSLHDPTSSSQQSLFSQALPTPQQQQNQQQPQFYPPFNANNANFINPFLLAGGQSQFGQTSQQLQQQQQQKKLLQQLQGQGQGGYPNLPSAPFQTVTPNQNPYQQPKPNNPSYQQNKYPFLNPANNNLGNLGNSNINQNPYKQYQQQQQQQQSFGSTLLNQQQYPKFPGFPFQTVSPTQYPPIDRNYNPQQPSYNNQPKIPLPRIRVIEFPSSEYFEYGGGKLVQPRRPNADLYVGGTGGDVPITSRVFIECTGPNQVEWIFNGTSPKKSLSVITKNIQITIPEQRNPPSPSGEYTYLRLGLDEQITEKDSGVYICRDRILPQNYISIRVLVAKTSQGIGRPNYPFRPKDPNTIYYSRNDNQVVLPCKIDDAQATISLHKHEGGKLSCPYTMDGRVTYDRYKGFTLQTQAFRDLEGRYVCVGDFNGELKLMKYKVVQDDDFTTRYVGGEAQNIIALDGHTKGTGGSNGNPSGSSTSASFLASSTPGFSKSVFSGITVGNLTGGNGFANPSEFDFQVDESFNPVILANNKQEKNDKSETKK